MKTIKFEHHLNNFYLSPLCPFRLGLNKQSKETVCNWHKNPEVIYVTRGEGVVRCNGVDYFVNAGCLFVVNPNEIHDVLSEQGIDYYFIIISDNFFVENGIMLDHYEFLHIIQSQKAEYAYNSVVHEIEQMIEKKDDLSIARVRRAVLTLIMELCADFTMPKEKKQKGKKAALKYVQQALDYINQHCSEDIVLERIADQIGISKYYLVREFKKHTGYTVVSYLNLLRCKNAEVFLAQGMSVTQAAMESGFESASYFSRMYKKIRGYAPTQYEEISKQKGTHFAIYPS